MKLRASDLLLAVISICIFGFVPLVVERLDKPIVKEYQWKL